MRKIIWRVVAPLLILLPYNALSEGYCNTIITLHGLNNRPDILNPLIDSTAKKIVNLNFNEAKSDDPLADWDKTYEESWQREKPSQSCVIGFSLGGAIAIRGLTRGIHPRKLLLLAPAISLRLASYLPRLLTPLSGIDLHLPSFSPRDFRWSRWTPLRHYRSMYSAIPDNGIKIPEGVTALIVVDPADELVSAKGLRKFAHESGEGWNIELVELSPEVGNINNHLATCCSPPSSRNGKLIRELTQSFFRS